MSDAVQEIAVTPTRLTVVEPAELSPLERAVEDYLTEVEARVAAQEVSPRTLSAYQWPLRNVFLAWARDGGLRDVESFDQARMNAFTAALGKGSPVTGRPLSPESIHTYLRPVRSFLRHVAAERGEMVRAKPKMPRLKKRDVDVLTRKEIERLLEVAPSERDRLMISVLSQTGMRVGELVGLRMSDLKEEGKRAYLVIRQAKGGDERRVPVEPALRRQIKELHKRRPHPDDVGTDHLFLAERRSRRTKMYEPLTVSGVEQSLRVLAQRAGIDAKRVHPHAFRHTHATQKLRENVNPLIVAGVLGHSSLRMIERHYGHLNPADAYDAYLGAGREDR